MRKALTGSLTLTATLVSGIALAPAAGAVHEKLEVTGLTASDRLVTFLDAVVDDFIAYLPAGPGTEAYFQGDRMALHNVPWKASGTPFQLKVWEALCSIPAGETRSYLDVAREVGCVSARAIGGANGLTNYVDATVVVRTDMDDAARVKTLAHELAHVLLHGPTSDDAAGHRGVAEVEAESVALMVGAAHGLDTSRYTVPYVTTWAASVSSVNPVQVVTATFDRKIAALREHRTQTSHMGEDLEPMVRDWLTRNAGVGGLPDGHLAEMYLVSELS